jgi:hypothetical protein
MSAFMLRCLFVYLCVFLLISTVGYPLEEESIKLEIINKITANKIEVTLSVQEEFFLDNISVTLEKCFSDYVFGGEIGKALIKMRYINENSDVFFNGWLFSDSMSLNSIEHPVYDINAISSCKARLIGENQNDHYRIFNNNK